MRAGSAHKLWPRVLRVWSLYLHNFSDLERGTHLARSSGHFCHLRGFFFPLLLETLLLGTAAPWPRVWRFPNAGLRFWNILRCLPALVPVKSHPWDLLSASSRSELSTSSLLLRSPSVIRCRKAKCYCLLCKEEPWK